MKIAIVGAIGEGKMHFIDTVLFPALLKQELDFAIYEGGMCTAHRGPKEAAKVVVSTFTYPQMAAKWLGRP